MTTLLDTLRQLIARLQGRTATAENAALLTRLMGALQVTHEDEIPCGLVYDLMDQYAEAKLRGEDIGEITPLIERHLQMCGHCREEFEMLLEMMQMPTAVG
jgi:hypothetical protein